MTTPKLQLVDIHKAFGPKKVLRGFNIDVAPGKSLVIIGGSGTGKSVSIKCAIGLIQPDKGKVLIDGEDVTNAHGKKREPLFVQKPRVAELFQKCRKQFVHGFWGSAFF